MFIIMFFYFFIGPRCLITGNANNPRTVLESAGRCLQRRTDMQSHPIPWRVRDLEPKAPEVDLRGLDEESADQVHKFSY
jgi:hypothetical protein